MNDSYQGKKKVKMIKIMCKDSRTVAIAATSNEIVMSMREFLVEFEKSVFFGYKRKDFCFAILA